MLLRACADVAVEACRFHASAAAPRARDSGGERTVRSRARRNAFERLGQTGVLLSGTRATRPEDVVVERNLIDRPGVVLRSAGGVVCSSCANTLVRANRVLDSPQGGAPPSARARRRSSATSPARSPRGDESDATGVVIERNELVRRAPHEGPRRDLGDCVPGRARGVQRVHRRQLRPPLGVYRKYASAEGGAREMEP